MREITLLISGFIAGLFLGYLAALCAFFSWSILQETFGHPRTMSFPGLVFLIGFFGICGLGGILWFVFQSWPVILGAGITFAHGIWTIYKSA